MDGRVDALVHRSGEGRANGPGKRRRHAPRGRPAGGPQGLGHGPVRGSSARASSGPGPPAVYLSEELENPRRNVTRTVLLTLGISAVVLLVPVAAITLGTPDLAALTSGDNGGMVAAWSGSGVATFFSCASPSPSSTRAS